MLRIRPTLIGLCPVFTVNSTVRLRADCWGRPLCGVSLCRQALPMARTENEIVPDNESLLQQGGMAHRE